MRQEETEQQTNQSALYLNLKCESWRTVKNLEFGALGATVLQLDRIGKDSKTTKASHQNVFDFQTQNGPDH